MNKEKSKKISYKILKIIWFIFGGLIALWTILLATAINSAKDFGVIIATVLFAIGIYSLIAFIAITLLFLIIKWIIKKCKKKSK
jgi:hypothetical protein